MKTIFQAVVVQVGEMVRDIAAENVLIFFDKKAPQELHDIAVLHEGGNLAEDIVAGDVFVIDDARYPIIFVGDKVNPAVKELGHVSVKYGGATEDMPGSICIDAANVPAPEAGDVIQILRA
ncbi:PTS glucitol/sorbitol transporter subunit IIA [Paenibacillus alkalitolerans]|uniref:PTS glucitol/sorbitol transporter subunit IIA n=1 Tax=Paenibacillus alkalitolerans TaxID=2799335 RepID=UPI0018F3A298|nr:PTS glucitol/sorbitol transporter subunit IIA [Paenibacillus alkalitolerans]